MEGGNGVRRETQRFLANLHGFCDLADQALERKFPDKEIGRFLVAADLSESHRPGTESVGPLDGGNLVLGLGDYRLHRRELLGRSLLAAMLLLLYGGDVLACGRELASAAARRHA